MRAGVFTQLAMVMLASALGACSQTSATAQTILAEGSITDLFSYLTSAAKTPNFTANLSKSSAMTGGDFVQQMFASVTDEPGEFAGKAYINLKRKFATVQSQTSAINIDALPTSIGTLIKSAGTLDRSAAQAYVAISNQASDVLAGRTMKGNLASYDDLKRALHVALALTVVQGFDCSLAKSSKNSVVPCYRDSNAQIGYYLITNGQTYLKNIASSIAAPDAVISNIGKSSAVKAPAATTTSTTSPATSQNQTEPDPNVGSGLGKTIQPATDGSTLDDVGSDVNNLRGLTNPLLAAHIRP